MKNKIIFALLILVNQSIFCQSSHLDDMKHVGLYNNSNVFLDIDSTFNYRLFIIPFPYVHGIYCEGKLNNIDFNNYELICCKPDSLNYKIETLKIGEIGKMINVCLEKTPWNIKESLSSIKIIVGENRYYMNKDSNYLFLLPTDSVIKYGGFKIFRNNYILSKNIYIDKDNISNYYFVSILDYNKCYDVSGSVLGRFVYDQKNYYKIKITNNTEGIIFQNDIMLEKMTGGKNEIINKLIALYTVDYRVILELKYFLKDFYY